MNSIDAIVADYFGSPNAVIEQHEVDDDAVIALSKNEFRAALIRAAEGEWLPIESAPKDGTEILGWREDCGTLMIRWTSPEAFCTDREIEELGDSAFDSGWFCADFVQGSRLDADLIPTLWRPLPPGPAKEL